ncbi:stromal interaction molecule 1 isoform X3 [Hyalella azteca]|uniref:Stromal interaction molecule 1 isoform X3 n=1 Tax=Hyalella azteca TaxID=294128 RepID=A0A8B7P2G0_HYAAZ|nr:stromal interaction molecule 1 isoform X3 [Hyalella azteca]
MKYLDFNMHFVRTILVLIICVCIYCEFIGVNENVEEESLLTVTATGDQGPCVVVDSLCLPEEDVSSYEAIRSLHRLLDDDKSGQIDMNESVEFLKEELTITDGYNSRQRNLHNNSDRFISVEDLWFIWKRSEVHNWTVEETVTWMSETVGLPQYADTIVSHGINGSYLPSLMKLLALSKCHALHDGDSDRLTMNRGNYLGTELGIKGLSHRTKVTVKAMDAVLFGPPKVSRNKDLLIAGLVTVILLGLGYIIHRNHKMRSYHTRLIMQIEELQLEEAKYRQSSSKGGDKHAEVLTSDSQNDAPDSGVMGDISDLSSTHEEDYDTYDGGRQGSSEDAPDSVDTCGYCDDDYSQTGGSGTPPQGSELDRASLVHWLQVTYQKEKHVLDVKRKQAQREFAKANEICNKLRAQGKNPLNLFSLMHGKMDNVEKTISLARATMQEVQRDENERQDRWSEIERLLECNIRRMAELHNVMGSYTSLQTTATAPGEASNIAETRSSALKAALARCPPHNLSMQHSATASTELGGRCEDEVDSISLPRSSSVGSTTANRLPSSSSHQHLSSEHADASSSYSHGSSSYGHAGVARPPLRKPRRMKASSVKLAPCNGIIPSAASVITTPPPVASIPEAPNNVSDNPECPSHQTALFSMGGSPLTMPPSSSSPTPLQESPASDLLTPVAQVVQLGGVSGSSSDPALSSAGALPSHHRTLSQLPSPIDPKLAPSSKARVKKKSFLERLASTRKSFQIKSSKS